MKNVPKPSWIRSRIPSGTGAVCVSEVIARYRLHTVCQEAACHNRGECWSRREATFLILGDICTRRCCFCNVKKTKAPFSPDPDEPGRVALAVRDLSLSHVVVTSVTRDDLPDKGSKHFAKTVSEIRKTSKASIELLMPDFGGEKPLLASVMKESPDVAGCNLETAERLYAKLRPEASYSCALRALEILKSESPDVAVKTALMAGLGETREEILKAAKDARSAGADIFYLGQYLQPSRKHAPALRYLTPEEFEEIGQDIRKLGFSFVLSGPFVRSSFRAEEAFKKYLEKTFDKKPD